MNPITITIESKPTTINFDGRELQVQKLSIPLPFGRNLQTSPTLPLAASRRST